MSWAYIVGAVVALATQSPAASASGVLTFSAGFSDDGQRLCGHSCLNVPLPRPLSTCRRRRVCHCHDATTTNAAGPWPFCLVTSYATALGQRGRTRLRICGRRRHPRDSPSARDEWGWCTRLIQGTAPSHRMRRHLCAAGYVACLCHVTVNAPADCSNDQAPLRFPSARPLALLTPLLQTALSAPSARTCLIPTTQHAAAQRRGLRVDRWRRHPPEHAASAPARQLCLEGAAPTRSLRGLSYHFCEQQRRERHGYDGAGDARRRVFLLRAICEQLHSMHV